MKMGFWSRSAAILASTCFVACQAPGDLADQETAVTTIDRQNDTIIARVDGTSIYASDVRRAAAAQGLIGPEETVGFNSPVFRLTAEELIDQRLLALDARTEGIDELDEAQRRLRAARERILGNLRVEAHLADAVNEDTMRALYDAQISLIGRGEERRVRQIVVADEATALSIAERLDDEEDFAQLVAEFSIDGATLSTDGEFGWVSRDMLPAAIQSLAFRTAVGGRSEPVQSEAGWHIVEVLDRRSPAPRSYEETKEEIARFMTFEAVEALMTDLRGSANIERLYEDMEPSDSDPVSSDTTPDNDPGNDEETSNP